VIAVRLLGHHGVVLSQHVGKPVLGQQHLGQQLARRLYLDEPLGFDLKETVCALDSTTVD
jgi:hypothetical protein